MDSDIIRITTYDQWLRWVPLLFCVCCAEPTAIEKPMNRRGQVERDTETAAEGKKVITLSSDG